MSNAQELPANPSLTERLLRSLGLTRATTAGAKADTDSPPIHGSAQKRSLDPSPTEMLTEALKSATASGLDWRGRPAHGRFSSDFCNHSHFVRSAVICEFLSVAAY